jgi:ribosomal protein L18E
MISSIQLRQNVKIELDRLKEKSSESYEDIIVKLLKLVEQQKRKRKELMIEGCKEMAEENLKMTKEWESTDTSSNWRW